MAPERLKDLPSRNGPEWQRDTAGESASQAEGTELSSGEGWLLYNEEHQTLICAFHGYAVRNLEGHLRDRHPDIDHRARSDLVRRHRDLQLQGPNEDQLALYSPSNPTQPIEGLPIHRGFACAWPACRHLTPSWKCLRVHFNDEHGVKGAKAREDLWTGVSLQTFFTGPKRAIFYFCVSLSVDGGGGGGGGDVGPVGKGRRRARRTTMAADKHQTPPEDQAIANITKGWILQKEEQEEMQKVIEEGILRHETTNWLKRTGWPAHFSGRNLADIQACSRMPGRDENELQRMVAVLDRLFFDRCIGGLKSMPLMTRLLLASPHPHDAHSRPFGPLQEKTSMDRYLIYVKRFLCYCFNVLLLEEDILLATHGFRFTHAQRTGLEELWSRLQDEEQPSDDGLQEQMLQILATFWTQRLDGDPFESPLWHFVGVLGIDGETGQL
ncbi:hypothetical protein FPOAC2_13285 [Fusarium poae]